MMWGYGYGYGWPGVFLMLISMLFWFGILGLLIWGLLRWMSRSVGLHGAHLNQGISAREILEQRYARGEIDEATFQQMRERLDASLRSRQLTQ